MLVLKTDAELSGEQKDFLRREIKDRTGEDSIILDSGFSIERLEVKKEQPLWRRLFQRG